MMLDDEVLIPSIVSTPEGVPLRFPVASVPERTLAFLIDIVLLFVVVMVMLLGVAFVLPSGWTFALFNLVAFLLRVGYFAWAETRWNGRTIGKRWLGLRVIRADGGPLTAEVLLARNLTREVEFFLPVTLLLAPTMFWSGHSALLRLGAGLWILLLLFLPLTNRLRLRVGDLLAGTRVVISPKATLLSDMARQDRPSEMLTSPGDAPLRFLPQHLAVYGIYELQVLEDVLRKAKTPGGAEAVLAVAQKIKARIGWDDAEQRSAPLVYLQEFYKAQRAHLEHKLLLGKRKERKEPKPPKPPRRR